MIIAVIHADGHTLRGKGSDQRKQAFLEFLLNYLGFGKHLLRQEMRETWLRGFLGEQMASINQALEELPEGFSRGDTISHAVFLPIVEVSAYCQEHSASFRGYVTSTKMIPNIE